MEGTRGTAPHFEVIVRALAPLIGPNMARSAARGQCDKLGLDAERLRDGDVERLVDALAPGLRVFVGRDKAEAALQEIRAALRRREP